MPKRSPWAALLLAPLLLAGCDLPFGSDEPKGLTLAATVDSAVATIGSELTYTASVADSRGRPVSGVKVEFLMTPQISPHHSVNATATTDRKGRATVTAQAPVAGEMTVTASSSRRPEIEPASATVLVRAIARFSVDTLSLTGPCDGGQISGFGRGSIPGATERLAITVEDTSLVWVTGIPRSGGATGYYGRLVATRGVGTTRIIGSFDNAADTIVVTVSPRTTPLSLTLRRYLPGAYNSPAPIPEAVSLAVGGTATVAVASLGCAGYSLPADYRIAYQSSDPAVVRVDGVVTRRVEGQQGSTLLAAEAQLTATGMGTAQITVTAPYSSPTTYTVTVQ